MMAALAAVVMVGCSGSSGPVPHPNTSPVAHSLSLPRVADGYRAVQRQTGGSIVLGGRSASELLLGRYRKTGSTQDGAILLVDAGHISGVTPRQLLTGLYNVFRQETGIGGKAAFGAMKAVAAGPLGGQAACWPVRASPLSIAMCAWADGGTFGLVLLPGTSPDNLAATMLRFRWAIEKSKPVS